MSLIAVTAGAARFVLLLLLSPPGKFPIRSLSEGTFARLSNREIGSLDGFDCRGDIVTDDTRTVVLDLKLLWPPRRENPEKKIRTLLELHLNTSLIIIVLIHGIFKCRL